MITPPVKVKDVPVPKRLRKRPRDDRGFPIPFGVLIYPDGTPDFRVNNEEKRLLCGVQHLCGLCGHTMRVEFAFIGGLRTVRDRFFFDPPMHEECAQYAKLVCPYLAYHARGYDNRVVSSQGVKIQEVNYVAKPDELALCVVGHFDLVRTGRTEPFLFRAGPTYQKGRGMEATMRLCSFQPGDPRETFWHLFIGVVFEYLWVLVLVLSLILMLSLILTLRW